MERFRVERTARYSALFSPDDGFAFSAYTRSGAHKFDENWSKAADANNVSQPVAEVRALTDASLHAPIRVICLQVSVRYFENGNDFEEGDDIREDDVGLLSHYALSDSLSQLRPELYNQLNLDSVPLKFHFARPHIEPAQVDKLVWVETIPWHVESQTQLRDIICKSKKAIYLSCPVSILKPSPVQVSEAEMKQRWEREKHALIMEIRNLEAKLAEALHQEEFSPENSLLKRALIALQKDGFISEKKSITDLEQEYLRYFSRHDTEMLFTTTESNPFRFMWRRLAEDPAAVRNYLECLQKVLISNKIRKHRVTSKFWMHVLRDMRFVADPKSFQSWSLEKPWTKDDSERAAYLASLVLADAVGLDEYRLLQDPIPGTDNNDPSNLEGSEMRQFNNGPEIRAIHRPETLAAAAERFHNHAIDRHSKGDTAVINLDSNTPVLQRLIKANEPCNHYEIDILAAQFGVCVCGFLKKDHLKDQTSSGLVGHPSQLHRTNRPVASIPCSAFRFNIRASTEETCVCGFTRVAHDHGPEATTQMPIERHQPVPSPRSSPVPCDNYEIDINAPRYGVCLCGHDKASHHSAVYATNDVAVENDTVRSAVEDEDRGVASATSQSRANNAVRWVEGEISRLLKRIELLGTRDETTGRVTITFGQLFATYQNVSDTLVGILIRAKRRKLLGYDGGFGDLLLQGKHDHVIITLNPEQATQWRLQHNS